MTTLAINTASSTTSIALMDAGKLVAEKSWVSHNDEAEKLMPEIQELLSENERDYSQLNKVLVVRGPGSFTGLRIGITVANTIAYLTKCSLSSVDTFAYHWSAAQLNKELQTDASGLLVFAGRKGVYFNKNERTEIINLDELNDFLAKEKIETIFGDISDEQKEILETVKFIDIKNTFGEVISYILENQDLEEVKMVSPFYVKDPAISKSKKNLYKN